MLANVVLAEEAGKIACPGNGPRITRVSVSQEITKYYNKLKEISDADGSYCNVVLDVPKSDRM